MNKPIILALAGLLAASPMLLAQNNRTNNTNNTRPRKGTIYDGIAQPAPLPSASRSDSGVRSAAPATVAATVVSPDEAKRDYVRSINPAISLPRVLVATRLTPRAPYVAGKGWLSFSFPSSFDTGSDSVEFSGDAHVARRAGADRFHTQFGNGARVTVQTVPRKNYLVTISVSWSSRLDVVHFNTRKQDSVEQTFEFRRTRSGNWHGDGVLNVLILETSSPGNSSIRIETPIEDNTWNIHWVEITPL